MGTKTLTDIHNDLKLLITAISGFEEGEDGFQICERFALSQIKYHRYLSVNSHAVKKEIEEITQKFLIHGKFDVAKEFQGLIQTFLTSFDFERLPQLDVQWSLLSLLLNLANETNKSEVSTPQVLRDQSHNVTLYDEDNSDAIDWAEYLKDGEQEFFSKYGSDSDSDWSDDENDSKVDSSIQKQRKASTTEKSSRVSIADTLDVLSCKSSDLPQQIISKNWLKKNIQSDWWNDLYSRQFKSDSKFHAANYYEIWNKSTFRNKRNTGTLSEYQACRELLWMFHTQATMVLFDEEVNNKFSIQDVSIPSLSSVAFKSMLRSFCQYYTMMKDIEIFFEKLFNLRNTSQQYRKPPLTYETYAAALQTEILNIKKSIIDFEIQLMKQDGQQTFLSLSKSLKRHLDYLKLIYEIHKFVTDDWEKLPNWQSASNLLSKLYHRMLNSSKPDAINMCASLYLTSLSVYFSIVDIWLSQGRLEDWREEFIIYKNTESIESLSREDIRPLEGFAIRDLNPMCMNDPVTHILINKVFKIGRSVELLVNLDRISDLWCMMDQENSIKNSLHKECLKEVAVESSKYSPLVIDQTDSVPVSIEKINEPRSFDHDIEQNIMQLVTAINNPFLTKALETFIPIEDHVDASLQKTFTDVNQNSNTEFVKNIEVVLPWPRILVIVVNRVLNAKFSGASKLVRDILMSEYKLEKQLKLMRSVYMMEHYTMNKFCNLFFHEIESNNLWNNAHQVTCLLEEILSHEWPESTSRWSITIANSRSTKVLEVVDGFKLSFAAGWPINMLLNDETLDKYNKIFRFELKLKWGLWTLNNLQFCDLEKTDGKNAHDKIQHFHIRRLESLRFWLLHAIGSIHSYLSGQVLQSLGVVLEKALIHSENLEAIITTHIEYVDNVHEHCLQTEPFNGLTSAIQKLLEMCEEVRSNWKPDSLSFISKALDQLENDYVKYHTYLAIGLHNAVQHKEADYHKSVFGLGGKFESIQNQFSELCRKSSNKSLSSSIPLKIKRKCCVLKLSKNFYVSLFRGEEKFDQALAYLRSQKELMKRF